MWKCFHAYISSPHAVSLTVCVLILNNNYHPISQNITPSFTTLASIRDLDFSCKLGGIQNTISQNLFLLQSCARSQRSNWVYLLFQFHQPREPEAPACCNFRCRRLGSGISPLPPADIICFTVTTQQHESDVDTLISCTHGCLAEAAFNAASPASPFNCRPYLTFAPGHNRHSHIMSNDFKISSLNGDLGMEDKSFTCTVCVIYG